MPCTVEQAVKGSLPDWKARVYNTLSSTCAAVISLPGHMTVKPSTLGNAYITLRMLKGFLTKGSKTFHLGLFRHD